jgi:hypothetical protein
MGNAAESGSGGGLRLQSVNGTELAFFPKQSSLWNSVSITNNIIANNVAGWDGAGVSMQDALAVNFVNNTVVSNDTTATSGVLFNTLGAPDASAPGATNQTTSTTTSAPQPAGLVVMPNSPNLTSSIAGTPLTCPQNNTAPGTGVGTSKPGSCNSVSYPYLANDVFWQNRAFYIGVGALSSAYQQNVVALFNAFTSNQPASQPAGDATTTNGGGVLITGGTGACVNGSSYWDIGIRGDSGPSNESMGFRLAPVYSVIDDLADYPGLHNTSSNPTVLSQYCNGSRTPPELSATGYNGFNVPPGISDATVPNPIFNLSPSATVDEGNNWINMTWGPLTEVGPVSGTYLANYGLSAGSPVIGYIPPAAGTPYSIAPTTDFYGNPRKTPSNPKVDAGAVQYQGPPVAAASVSPTSLTFTNVVVTTTSAAQNVTVTNTGNSALAGGTFTFPAGSPFSRSATAPGTCGPTLAAGTNCTIGVVFSPTVTGPVASSLAVAFTGATVTPASVTLNGTGVAAVKAVTFLPASWTVTQARNCPGTGLGVITCGLDPSQAFTLTNTGNVPLTGITQGVLAGTAANLANYKVLYVLSSCGPANNGQLVSTTTLAPGGTCVVRVQFQPLTSQAAGLKSATIGVTDSVGAQTATLNGTAK